MSDLLLYLYPGTCAMAVHIALLEAHAGHQVHVVDFAAGEQRTPAFLALNPLGRVPALRTEHGVLTETLALLLYVAQRFPAAKLAPLDDAYQLARMQSFNSFLASTVHVGHAHRPRANRWADDPAAIAAMQQKVPENMHSYFTQIEQYHLTGPWVLGEQFSVADIYLYVIASWLKADGVDINDFPRVAAHTQRMLARPSVQAALQLV